MFFQYATVAEFCEVIERLSGRTVRAFISGIDTEVAGLSVEMFVLHPAGSNEPSRGGGREPALSTTIRMSTTSPCSDSAGGSDSGESRSPRPNLEPDPRLAVGSGSPGLREGVDQW